MMTAPLSQDLRQRIVRSVTEGSSIRQAAERFEVSPSAAIKLMQRVRRTGDTRPGKIGGLWRAEQNQATRWSAPLHPDTPITDD